MDISALRNKTVRQLFNRVTYATGKTADGYDFKIELSILPANSSGLGFNPEKPRTVVVFTVYVGGTQLFTLSTEAEVKVLIHSAGWTIENSL